MTTEIYRHEGHALADAVHVAARVHNSTWEALVPDSFIVNPAAELAEERAYADMAAAKQVLRDHICETYGISVREPSSLAVP